MSVQPTQPDEILLKASRFSVVRKHCLTADGRPFSKEAIEHPGAVVILPMLTDDTVVLIRNHRVAVGETLWELPAGTLEPGEPPAQTATRELAEETGYRCAKIQKLLEMQMSPGILNERMHLYLAEGLTPGEPQLELGEEIETFPTSWRDTLVMIARGEIQDAKTLVAILFYERFRRSEG